MPISKVIIIGSSGHAKVVIDIFEKEGKYSILGLIDAYKPVGEIVLGYAVIGNEEDIPQLLKDNPDTGVFIAIGDNWVRKQVYEKILALTAIAVFVSAVHPSAQIAKQVQIGKGVAIMPGVIVNSNTIIGDFTILNTKSSIDHDSRMDAFSSLAPNVTTGGNVVIGSYSAISISATIKHGISVGQHTVIGAGALLLEHIGDNLVAYGTPAKTIRSRKAGEKYL